MSEIEILSTSSTILQVNAGLLGVAVTLLSLVPTLVGVVNEKETGYLQTELAKRSMEQGLNFMRVTIFFFAAGSLVGLATILNPVLYMLICGAGFAFFGVVVIMLAAFRLARISHFVVKGDKL